MSARRSHLASAETYFSAGSEAAEAAPLLSSASAASTIKDIFYTVELTPDGRFVIMAPDRLTVIQYYDAADMDGADAHAAMLNLPIWERLRPKGLVGYEPPAPDPGDALVALLDRGWGYEDGPPLPPAVRRESVYDVAAWVSNG